MENFALFSLPFSDKIYFIKGTVFYFENNQNLEAQIGELGSGFLVHPFEISSQNNACFIQGKIEDWEGKNILECFYDNENNKTTEQSEFVDLANKAIENIKSGITIKIVTSRITAVKITSDLTTIFQKLKSKFPNCFVCLFSDKKLGTWISASPEILLKNINNFGETFSMAGTKNILENFSQKEIKEQKIVTDYIIETIKEKHPKIEIKSNETEISFGEIKHLLTQIQIETEESLLPLAFQLHPTPAVCGVDKNKAKEFILSHEKFDRQLYTGFWGPVFSAKHFEFYVNLRTMKINSKEEATIYAGAGITDNSVSEKEWKETERKTEIFASAFQK